MHPCAIAPTSIQIAVAQHFHIQAPMKLGGKQLDLLRAEVLTVLWLDPCSKGATVSRTVGQVRDG